MSAIHILEREMTDAELARRRAGSDEYTIEQGNPIQTSEQFNFVALDGEAYIGCAVGVAYKNGLVYNGWAYLSELFVEKPYRGQGLGAAILCRLEERVARLGITSIWTRTAGYEAPRFYSKQGYQVCFELENWYSAGHSHIGLRKALMPPASPHSRGDLGAFDGQRSNTNTIHIVEREMTAVEFARMNAGFDEHTIEHGDPIETSERHGFVALDGEAFVGCVSGLAHRNDLTYNKWFVLSDLFLEKAGRGQGIGTALLQNMEERAAALGCRNISTWIAGYEAVGFFKKHGYEVFCELENWYSTGHSRVGLRKTL